MILKPQKAAFLLSRYPLFVIIEMKTQDYCKKWRLLDGIKGSLSASK